jgi:hydrogenase nickel incorporation protein HypA/HybF
MHEYSLVEALVRRVEEEARRRGAVAVHGLRVSVGELAGVELELFRAAYQLFREGTLCAGAALELVTVPAGWSCPRCERPVARGALLRCPSCGAPARMSERAGELLLESIDMEVP